MSVSYISGKLVSDSFLGKLGSLTYKCYSGVSGCIQPALDNGEQNIYSLLFLGDYYNKQVSQYIGAAGVKRVINVKEGDSSITLQNSNESAKIIKTLAKDYHEQAKEMADLYNRGQATARDVQFYTINPYGNFPQTNESRLE
jgi:glutathionyl-hydroquinone reductase